MVTFNERKDKSLSLSLWDHSGLAWLHLLNHLTCCIYVFFVCSWFLLFYLLSVGRDFVIQLCWPSSRPVATKLEVWAFTLSDHGFSPVCTLASSSSGIIVWLLWSIRLRNTTDLFVVFIFTFLSLSSSPEVHAFFTYVISWIFGCLVEFVPTSV